MINNIANKSKIGQNRGFTIVELLITIVIIALLSTIVFVSYRGITTRATEATLQSDLANASKKLKLYYVEHNIYPQDIDTNGCPTIPVDNNYCIKPTPGNIFVYTATAPYLDYTLTVEKGDTKYKILGSDTTPTKMDTTPIAAISAIIGTVKEGQTLTAGALTPAGATVSYQWQIATTSNGAYTNIAGATNNTYIPVAGDVGKYLKVQVTGTSGYSGIVISSATSTVAAKTPITAVAAITGTAQIGQTLTAGAVTPAGATVSYQWQAATTSGGTYTNISGAINNTYVVSPNVMGKYIKVSVTGTDGYGNTLTSAATALVPTNTAWLTIGTQTWAKTNLNVGTMITGTVSQTNNGTTEKYCYNNTTSNCTTYGGLYRWGEAMNYSTVEGAQGLCPAGSHVPSDNDWKVLEMQLGMTQAQADGESFRGTDQATKLKSGGTSGLNLPLGGWNGLGGPFDGGAVIGQYWSSSEIGIEAWHRSVYIDNAQVIRGTTHKDMATSVRCIGN